VFHDNQAKRRPNSLSPDWFSLLTKSGPPQTPGVTSELMQLQLTTPAMAPTA
jgi:hypothetical protein